MLPGPGQVEEAMEVRERCEARARRAGAVIAPFQRDEMLLVRAADGVVVMDDVADRRIHRIRSTQREIDMIQPFGAEVDQLLRQPHRRFAAEMEIARGIGQAAHLLGRDFGDAVLAIADIDAP